ncbi:MAG: hypothetical protein QG603_281 [Patescibacteria group bacterium]|nr:hypothetical protein [Patescibacteria group bacterium]MDQ5970504.1 hypothetical protein [Patescibacteria group bacterium]
MEPIINQQMPMPENKNKTWLWIIIVLLVAGLAGAGVYYWQNMEAKKLATTAEEKVRSEMQVKITEAESKLAEAQNIKTTNWYSDFITKITQLDIANIYDPKCQKLIDGKEVSINCTDGKITENMISEIYYTNALSYVDMEPVYNQIMIALIPGSYMGPGFKLVKYDIKNGNITIADREDVSGGKNSSWFKIMDNKMPTANKKDTYLWFNPPNKFLSVNDKSIELIGTSGDAGCGVSSTYIYDIEKNYINVVKSCSKCEGEKEECTQF